MTTPTIPPLPENPDWRREAARAAISLSGCIIFPIQPEAADDAVALWFRRLRLCLSHVLGAEAVADDVSDE